MENVTGSRVLGLKPSENEEINDDYETFLPRHRIKADHVNIRGVSGENRRRMSRLRALKERLVAKRKLKRLNASRKRRACWIQKKLQPENEESKDEVIKSFILNNSNCPQCRLCGAREENLINVLQQNSEVLEMIRLHLHVEINEDDNLSHFVCESCRGLIKNWDEYFLKCSVLQTKLIVDASQPKKSDSPPAMDITNIKSEIIPTEEDDIEKLLRQMHAESPQETQEDDYEMDVEYLEEEQDLVDEALLLQSKSLDDSQTKSNLLEDLAERSHLVKEEDSNRKIFRSSHKLSEEELRAMLEKNGFGELTTVKVLKFNRRSNIPLSIDKYLYDFNKILAKAKLESSLGEDREYYNILAKSYDHQVLEYIQSDSEMYFRCPECKFYFPSSELPQHIFTEHQKRAALCDFCRLLLPYETAGSKSLVKEHIELHEANYLEDDPKIIMNICQLLEFSEVKQPKQVETDVKVKKDKEKLLSRFRCTQCNGRFQTAELVREHVKLHRYEKLSCEECNKYVFSQFQLQNHHKLEHGIKTQSEWFCQFCNLKLADQASFDDHLKQVVHPDEFFCPHCNISCSSIENLENHCQTHSKPTFICEICGAAFPTKQTLKVHTDNMHTSALTTYTCPHCQHKNFSQVGLRNHIRMHHSEKKVVCEECSEVFPSEPILRDHIKQKHQQIQCDSCPQTFTSPNRLREHYKQKHQQAQNYQCPLCDWTYNHGVNLKKHFEVHIEKGHTICKVCNQEFEVVGEKLEIEDVIRHKAGHSVEENFVYQRPYSPNVGRMTPWKDNSGARMFCKDCGIACSVPVELRKHQKTHKPFYCATCHTVSLNEQTFLLHMEQHADRKYACKTCSKPFLTQTALNLHSRIHVHSPKYECAVCLRKFLIVADWRRHERSCRESHAWPRMNPKTSEERTPKRKRKLQTEQSEADSVKYVDQSITYELVDEESQAELLKEEDYIEYIVQDEDSGNEIDELPVQQWQKSSDRIKPEILTYGEEVENQEINPVYYSIEEVPGNKKQFRFIPQYVIQESKDDSESSQEQKFITLPQDDSSQTDPNFVIPSEGDAEEGVEEEGDIVYTISNEEGNMVYNIQDNLSLAQAANIIFEEENQEEENSNMSYVFDNSDNSNITIFFKDKEGDEADGE